MTTALYTHDDCLNHVTPPGHPEQVARLKSIAAALSPIEGLDRREAPLCSDDDILRCHPRAYLDAIASNGAGQLDPDTWMSEGSYQAARRAVGGAVAAVDAVMAGDVTNAFVACRPPGHHAETQTPMGFCFFGNVSIAAKHALDHHGLSRVAVIDFDVHHGNGTQDLLWNEPRALFATSQQMPLWPGTGEPSETGAHDNVVNVPLAPGSTGGKMRLEYEAHIFPRVDAFAPEMILISAGFDAHAEDPLANLMWETEDFAWLTEQICALAEKHCDGRIVSVLEGGYDLDALGQAAAAHVRGLMAA
ncbi:histone deacetylase family protein [Alisedimentitalea sp. MJ-SS2]|uniref:histone deacetylase family protein n=1 Tax=Aliisedimentitalea sp. MJ-SS2 TaxID=3049795 RepID=UPI002912D691|nr:histone deacetylase family protein [Alisedimentitalea sp. MJ-SS2]MDU8927910.1 histone deacetylase family protein [Alisedimentitalea sp. MJ-SS2]